MPLLKVAVTLGSSKVNVFPQVRSDDSVATPGSEYVAVLALVLLKPTATNEILRKATTSVRNSFKCKTPLTKKPTGRRIVNVIFQITKYHRKKISYLYHLADYLRRLFVSTVLGRLIDQIIKEAYGLAEMRASNPSYLLQLHQAATACYARPSSC